MIKFSMTGDQVFYFLPTYLPFNFWQGNFDSYVQTRIELEENQMKRYKWEQDQIAHMKVGLSTVVYFFNLK